MTLGGVLGVHILDDFPRGPKRILYDDEAHEQRKISDI